MLCASRAPLILGIAGEKSGFALFFSFPRCFLMSRLSLGKNRCVSPLAEAEEGADGTPCCPPPRSFYPRAAPALRHGSRQVPGGCFSLLPPLAAPFLLLAAGLRVLSWRSQGSGRAPIAGGLAPSPAANAHLCRA